MAGSDAARSEKQSEKAYDSSSVSDSGILTSPRLSHRLKALLPICVSPSGSDMARSLAQ